MARSSKTFNNFTSGEWSEILYGRNDLEKHDYACKRLENMIIYPYGGAFSRPGTRYLGEAKYSDKKCKLVSFNFSTTTTFVIEAGEEYMRFWSNRQQVVDALDAIVEVETPYQEDELFELDYLEILDVVYFVHKNHPVKKLTRIADDDWTFEDVIFSLPPFRLENIEDTTITASDTTGTVTLTASDAVFDESHIGSYWKLTHRRSSNSVVTKISTLTLPAPLYSDQLAVLGDWEFETKGSDWSVGTKINLQRSEDDAVTWENIRTYEVDGSANVIDTGTEDGKSYEIEDTTDSDVLYRAEVEILESAGDSIYISIKCNDQDVFGYVKITGFTSDTVVTGDVVKQIYSTEPTRYWNEGSWSEFRGYPSSINLFEQRMILASTNDQPQTLWFSVTSDFNNFGTNSLSYTIGSKEYNKIEWVLSEENLLVGTAGGEWTMKGYSDEPFGDQPPKTRRSSTVGSNEMQPRMVGDVGLFFRRDGKAVHEFTFTLQDNKYNAPDLTLLANHIAGDGFTDSAYQQLPQKLLWCVKENGDMASLTYERDQNVVGWSVSNTDGEFESVASVYGPGADEVYVSVNRENGRFIEYMDFDQYTTQADAVFSDSAVIYDGVETTVIDGLDHLEGQLVDVLSDGSVEYEQDEQHEVVDGEITINEPSSKVVVGLRYIPLIQPLPVARDQNGDLITNQKVIKKSIIRYKDTVGATYSDGETDDYLEFRSENDYMDTAVPEYTGFKTFPFDGRSDPEPTFIVKQILPLPFNILSITLFYDIQQSDGS